VLFSAHEVVGLLSELTGAVAPRLLSAEQLAERWGVAIAEVDSWHAEGLLPRPLRVRGITFWRFADILLWEATRPEQEACVYTR